MKWKHDKLNLLGFLSVLLLCGCSLLKFVGGLTHILKTAATLVICWEGYTIHAFWIYLKGHAWFPSCTSWVFPVFSNAISTSFINYWHVSIYVFKAFKEAEIPDIEGKWPRLALKYTWTWTVCVLSRKKAIACMYVWWLTHIQIWLLPCAGVIAWSWWKHVFMWVNPFERKPNKFLQNLTL